ncbi:MAG: response regulator [Verrucomicrobiae bacterium]|nr:response regulator [Verrucomicrobiae bacterium]
MALDHRKLILIVEDEPDLSRLLEFYLQHCGYDTLIAHDGQRGFEQASRRWPDLIILDLMLPRMHGLEVCRLLKSNPHTAHIPILILTALETDEYRQRGLAVGADSYLVKPFDAGKLLSRVDGLLAKNQATRGGHVATVS